MQEKLLFPEAAMPTDRATTNTRAHVQYYCVASHVRYQNQIMAHQVPQQLGFMVCA